MARWDKVDSSTGMHRAHLKDAVLPADFDTLVPIGLDAAGLAVQKVPGNSGFVGIAILHRLVRRAGSRIDIASHAEAVECDGLVAGTKYYIAADGTLTTAANNGATPPVANIYVGYTIEADRLVVNFTGKG